MVKTILVLQVLGTMVQKQPIWYKTAVTRFLKTKVRRSKFSRGEDKENK